MAAQLENRRTVIAYNDAADSGNPMHDDAAARALNFKGALVPGVTVYGYLTHALVTHFGEKWLDRGTLSIKFRLPVYAQDVLTITAEEENGATDLQVAAINPDGEACVIGHGACPEHKRELPPLPPNASLPEQRKTASRETFASLPVLGSINVAFASADADEFLSKAQDDLPIYRRGVTHPSWLLRQANIIVDRNFNLGPWIHVSSDIQNLGTVTNDTPVEVRAKVIEVYERNGHEYADLDVAMLADGDPSKPIMRVRHRVIYIVRKSS